MRLADGNHVIQQCATAAADPALGYTVLPRTTHCSPRSLDVHGANRDGHFGAVLGVVIQEEKLGRPFVGKGFAQLLHDPSACRMAGARVLMRTGNLAAVMRTMGHRDVKTAMHYQHPELEIVRAALD